MSRSARLLLDIHHLHHQLLLHEELCVCVCVCVCGCVCVCAWWVCVCGRGGWVRLGRSPIVLDNLLSIRTWGGCLKKACQNISPCLSGGGT